MNKGDLEASNDAICHAVRLAPDWADAHYFHAWLACDRGEDAEAIASFSKTLELNPHQADAYEQRGRLYFFDDKMDQAWSDFQSAIETGGTTPAAYVGSAAILNEREQYEEAIEFCNQILEIEPKEIFALKRRAEAYLGKGDTSKCIADATAVLELEPECVEALYIRSGAYRAIGEIDQADTDKAIADELLNSSEQ